MLFNFGLRSSLLLIFFFHGLVYSGLLLRKGIQYNHLPSRLLSLFIFLCCLYIAPWMLGHAGWYSIQPYRDILFYVPFHQVFFLGPVIFFYTQSLLNKSFRFSRTDWLHFLPGFGYLLYSLVVFIVDKVILQEYYFYLDERDKDLALWYQISGLISMVIYFLLSLRYYTIYRRLAYQVLSFAESALFGWIKKFLVAFLVMQLARVLFLFIYPEWGNFPEKFWYYFIFALLFYYVAIAGYSNTVQAVIPFRLSLFDRQPTYLIEEANDPVETKVSQSVAKREENIDIENWKRKIEKLLQEENIFKNPGLALADIAKKLGTNPRVVSKVINLGFEMNFNDFINHYRIEAVKEKLQQNAQQDLTLLAIALDCGFNSKATFNRAFKKHTSVSPKTYLERLNK